MTKTEFLLTISIHYQADKWREKRKYQLGDYWLIQYQILQTNITRTIWQTVRRIADEILGVKGLRLSYMSHTFEQMHKTNFKTCTKSGWILTAWGLSSSWMDHLDYNVRSPWLPFQVPWCSLQACFEGLVKFL